jgi:hypothetical protein
MCAEHLRAAEEMRLAREAAIGWVGAADPHAARASRRAPIDLRTTGPGSWPFRTPRRHQLSPVCPTLRCAGAG